MIDERLQAGRFSSANRLWFMSGSVSALATALEVRGSGHSVTIPDGEYVRRWMPELAGLEGQAVHPQPPGTYLAPMVDHREARARALTAYREATRAC